MPGPHRRFLQDISKIANIREYVMSHSGNCAVQIIYNGCLEQLATYRNKHIQIVSRYIVLPSRTVPQTSLPQAVQETSGKVSSTRNNGGERMPEIKKAAVGTGGTAPVDFLKQVRDETRNTSIN